MGPWNGWHMSWGGMFLGGLMMVLFWGAIIFLAAFAVRWLIGNSRSSNGDHLSARRDALEILKERYARGEITREQYQDMRRELET